jgi:hypothetical protein
VRNGKSASRVVALALCWLSALLAALIGSVSSAAAASSSPDWAGAPGWSQPTRVSDPCGPPLVLDAFGEPDGTTTIVVGSPHHATLCLLTRHADGTWSSSMPTLTAEPEEVSHLVAPGGVALITWRESDSAARLMASVRGPSGRWGSPRAIGGTPRDPPTVAARPDGELIATWVELSPPGLVARVATWRQGAGWSRPVTLGATTGSPTRLVVAPSGSATVVWAAPAGVGVTSIDASHDVRGARWSPPAVISQTAGDATVDSVIRTEDGTLVAAASAFTQFQPTRSLIFEKPPGGGWNTPVVPNAHGSGDLVLGAKGNVEQLLADSVGPTHWLSSRTRGADGHWTQPRGLIQDQALGIDYARVAFPDGSQSLLVSQQPTDYCAPDTTGHVICVDVGLCPGLLESPRLSPCQTSASWQRADGSWTKPQRIGETGSLSGLAVSQSGVAVAGFCLPEKLFVATVHNDCQLSIGARHRWRKPIRFARDAQIDAISALPSDELLVVFTRYKAHAQYLAATTANAADVAR